jgi:hypothetical protein
MVYLFDIYLRYNRGSFCTRNKTAMKIITLLMVSNAIIFC